MKTSTAGIRPATISRMPTASATDQYGSGCRNRQPVSHHGTRTAPTPPVTTNQAALVITAADLRITIHPLGPPGRCRHRVAFRRGGRSRYAFRGSPTMAWIGGHGLSPTTAHVALGVSSCSVSDPVAAAGHDLPGLVAGSRVRLGGRRTHRGAKRDLWWSRKSRSWEHSRRGDQPAAWRPAGPRAQLLGQRVERRDLVWFRRDLTAQATSSTSPAGW